MQKQVLIGLQHHLHTYIPVVCGIVMVGVMNGAPLVDGGDAVRVTSLVGCTTFVLLIVLGPVEKKVEGTVHLEQC